VLEDLEVELLDDVVGLRERLEAGVPAVQEDASVVHQAVAGQLQQPLPVLGVARHGPLQLRLQDGGRFVAHLPHSLRSGRRALRFSLFEPDAAVREKKPAVTGREKFGVGAMPRCGCRRGKDWEAGSTLCPSERALIFLLIRATPGSDARGVTLRAEIDLR
jgi:hypothetical protein